MKEPSPPAEGLLSLLAVRQEPDAKDLINDMTEALRCADESGFLTRMENNRAYRNCQWEGQSDDGLKHAEELGVSPDQVFPWDKCADGRVRKIDVIVRERVDLKMAGFDMGERRALPRHLDTDADKNAMAQLWTMTADYYGDQCAREMRRAAKGWVDIAEEFGHAIIGTAWKREQHLERRTLSADQLLQAMAQIEVQLETELRQQAMANSGLPAPAAMGGETEQAEVITDEEVQIITAEQAVALADDIQDRKRMDMLKAKLLTFDPQMPASEAARVAAALRQGEEAVYYVKADRVNQPEWRALRPFVDVFYPPETTRIQNARWVVEVEWVSDVQLRERVESEGYSASWVSEVIKHPGTSFTSLAVTAMTEHGWLLSGAGVGGKMVRRSAESKMFQILHLHYRATAMGGVPALYHTVLHAQVDSGLGLHECSMHQHGQYPFIDHVREDDAVCLIDSRGVPELSFTEQASIKRHRDMRDDSARQQILPPALVPARQAGGRWDLSPGSQTPRKLTMGAAGGVEFIAPKVDMRGSLEIEKTISDALDEYWFRGPNVDPDVKLTRRRVMTKEFLIDAAAVWLQTFQLIQQFSPDEIKATFVDGVDVDLNATRAEIQGQVAIDFHFDPADLDYELLGKKLELMNTMVRPMDTEGSMLSANIVGVAMTAIMPAWAKRLTQNVEAKARDEIKDERDVLSGLLNGLEGDYTRGKNHRQRMQVLEQQLGIKIDNEGNWQMVQPLGPNGQPSRAQQLIMSDPDVNALVTNRTKFHAFQVSQSTDQAESGRRGVKTVRPE